MKWIGQPTFAASPATRGSVSARPRFLCAMLSPPISLFSNRGQSLDRPIALRPDSELRVVAELIRERLCGLQIDKIEVAVLHVRLADFAERVAAAHVVVATTRVVVEP